LESNSSLSTAFHPQTDGQTERVNQEVWNNTYASSVTSNRIIGQNSFPSWNLPITLASHSATGKSPFMIWYGYHPRVHSTTTVCYKQPHRRKKRLVQLNRLRSEVTASLKLAAEVMKTPSPSNLFCAIQRRRPRLARRNYIHTTHPKAKLCPETSCDSSSGVLVTAIAINTPRG